MFIIKQLLSEKLSGKTEGTEKANCLWVCFDLTDAWHPEPDGRAWIRVIDSCQSLTLARPFICEQLVAFLAAAFEGAHRVAAEVVAASVVLLALVDVWVEKIQEWETEGPSAGAQVHITLSCSHESTWVTNAAHVSECTALQVQMRTAWPNTGGTYMWYAACGTAESRACQ